MTVSVRLSLAQQPVFPLRCVFCGCADSQETFDLQPLVVVREGWFVRPFTRKVKATLPPLVAPACFPCRHPLRATPLRAILRLVLVLVGVVGLVIGGLYAHHIIAAFLESCGLQNRPASTISKVILAIAGTLCFTAAVVAQKRWCPEAVSIEASDAELLFEFRDRQYGQEFEAVNRRKPGIPAEPAAAPDPAA
jgi:hypothetical protein